MMHIPFRPRAQSLLALGLFGALGLWALLPAPANARADNNLLLVLDASGSMWGQVDGQNKIVIARNVLADLVRGLPPSSDLGLIAYGHRSEGDCRDIETVVAPGPLAVEPFITTVNALAPKGKTPITNALRAAVDLARERPATTIVLLTDGLETCDGDPCALAREARTAGVDFVLHIIGFDVQGEDVSSLECTAQAGGGLYLSADDASQLAGALDQAIALPADAPASALLIEARANGALQDVSVYVTRAGTDQRVAGSRTYEHANTNPRRLPVPAGTYDVVVTAVGLRGATEQRFDGLVVAEGETVERRVDFTEGEIAILVTRNGVLSDATVMAYVSGTRQQVASGRSYRSANSNPRRFALTAGLYDVVVGSVEIAGAPGHRWDEVRVGPGETVSLEHDLPSATLRVGARRGDALVDATIWIQDTATGKEADRSRTYTAAASNPKEFVLSPGSYRVTMRLAGSDEEQQLEVRLEKGGTTEHMFDF
jgi:Ca-activated chloride channel family protein